MYRLITTLIYTFLTVITFSCGSKNTDGIQPAFYVKAKINGVDYFHNASNKNRMISYYEPNNYLDGGFSFSVNQSGGENFGFSCVRAQRDKAETLIVWAGGYGKTLAKEDAYAANSARQANGMCYITKKDDNVIEGTFYFDVYSQNGVGNTKVSITEGQFRLEL